MLVNGKKIRTKLGAGSRKTEKCDSLKNPKWRKRMLFVHPDWALLPSTV